ncbi:23S rRNA (guanosine(2251)-2'-O)-methyltransferase RlmB [Telmatospirillum sp. J64-1]|uniref:23S rRNA (guanosine(2251)-2'-O)-methyltransferase RlmB n=1 Tax=Telmatospirillum sp. J64-1 TaxID=2502183 RepID=UPI00115E4BB2|nr:23S rRNA (guanosine(2251)-2'-O)-methyltransferase RlmB [Telmatospirillum sp. J64-1]
MSRQRNDRSRPSRPSGRRGASSDHLQAGKGGLWLWGTHPVLAALANPQRPIRRFLATADSLRDLSGALDDIAAKRAFPQAETVARDQIDALLPPGAVHQGIACQVEPLPALAIEDVARLAEGREQAVVVVLDQVTDPHNVGAILRSAAAFGALAVIVPDRHAPDETGTLAKSASGALERLPLVRVTNLARALDDLKQSGFWIAGLAGEATQTLAEAKLSGRIALVLGSEGEGLRRLTREHCDYLVRLPMTDAVESLNVSNAAAVALYETARGR